MMCGHQLLLITIMLMCENISSTGKQRFATEHATCINSSFYKSMMEKKILIELRLSFL